MWKDKALPGYVLLLLSVAVMAAYYLYFKEFAGKILLGTAPGWVIDAVNHYYPRFESERQRYDLAFVQQMSFQVFFRLAFVLFAVGLFNVLYHWVERIKNGVSGFLFQSTSRSNLRMLTILFYAIILYFY